MWRSRIRGATRSRGLAPLWSARLGRAELVGLQASARSGLVRTRVAGDRVLLAGHAVTTLDGTLLTAPRPSVMIS